MSDKLRIKMDRFIPRDYQLPVLDAIENKGFRKICIVAPRRSGKDYLAFNIVVRQALKRVGVYAYALPTFSQARKVIWQSIDNSGRRIIDCIPKELIKSMNSSELKITLVNNSIIQLIGSDSFDTSLVGTNPVFIVFSEFALAHEDSFKLSLPIVNANNGTIMLISTPRGRNFFYDVYNMAKDSPDWFVQKLSIEDTNHIPLSMIQQDIDDGLVSQELVQQEYYCSFESGHEGAYYAKNIDKCRMNGQIGRNGWDPSYRVFTAWDLGLSDHTSIIFYQLVGTRVHVIDCYENNGHIISHYVDVVLSKPYKYDKHWGPHDISVRDLNTGYSRTEVARQLGLNFETRDNGLSSALPNIGFANGINTARATLAITYFDEEKCADLIKALENYREQKNKFGIGTGKEVHDRSSHYADAFRYLAVSLSQCRAEQSTPEQLEMRYQQALNGNRSFNPFTASNDFNSPEMHRLRSRHIS